MKRSHAVEIRIFNLKVKYWASKVRLLGKVFRLHWPSIMLKSRSNVGIDKVNISFWPQGHRIEAKVRKVIFSFLAIFSTSSYSFHRRVLKMHRNVLLDNMQRSHAAYFRIFAFKVKCWASKVLPWNTLLTALMNLHFAHIKVMGTIRKGQHPILTAR